MDELCRANAKHLSIPYFKKWLDNILHKRKCIRVDQSFVCVFWFDARWRVATPNCIIFFYISFIFLSISVQ